MMINNVLNLIEKLQQLIDYEVVDTYRIKEVVSEAIRWLKVIPEGGVSYFESFHSCWITEGYDPSWKFENQLSTRDYYKVIEILNESSIRVIEETVDKVDLFDMESKTTYVLGNLADANITKEQYDLLVKVGLNHFEVVNKEEAQNGR